MITPYQDKNRKLIGIGDMMVSGRKNSRELKVELKEYDDNEYYDVKHHYGFVVGKMTLPDALALGWFKK